MTGNIKHHILIRFMTAALLVLCVLLLAGCGENKAAESQAAQDIEDMRYVELDQETNAELESMLSDQGREFLEMFLGKAGEFDYTITGSDEADDNVIVHVRITTYDFASEYLRSWSEFLEESDSAVSAAGAEDSKDTAKQEKAYDSAKLYETLFRNLSNVQNKDYTANVDITCMKGEDGAWKSDAASNAALRDAILGGMIREIRQLAEMSG